MYRDQSGQCANWCKVTWENKYVHVTVHFLSTEIISWGWFNHMLTADIELAVTKLTTAGCRIA